jgi:hypothetical protein
MYVRARKSNVMFGKRIAHLSKLSSISNLPPRSKKGLTCRDAGPNRKILWREHGRHERDGGPVLLQVAERGQGLAVVFQVIPTKTVDGKDFQGSML